MRAVVLITVMSCLLLWDMALNNGDWVRWLAQTVSAGIS